MVGSADMLRVVLVFVLGVVAGALLSIAIGGAGHRGASPALAQDSGGDVGLDEGALRKIAELREQLAAALAATRTSPRLRADDESEAQADPHPLPEALPASELERRLQAELVRLVATADVSASFRGKAEELFRFVVEAWLANDRPEAALALMQRFDAHFDVGLQAIQAGAALRTAGKTALATEAYLLGLRTQTADAMLALADIAPERGLRALDAVEGKIKYAWLANEARVRFLIALGRSDEAIARVDDAMKRGIVSMRTWPLLIKLSPADAESRIRRQIERGGLFPPVERELKSHLVDALVAQGRRQDAIALLERGLAKSLEEDWIAKLGDLARERALSLLEGHARLRPADAKVLGMLGGQLLAAKREKDAFPILLRSYEIAADNGVAERMLQADPVRATQILEGRARSTKNDEVLGEIADAMWRLGQRVRAVSLWEDARRFDPDDEEWTRKLRAVAARRDPLKE